MIVQQQPGMGGELADAWSNLTKNVGDKLTSETSKVEMALTVAAFASVAAAAFSAVAAWNSFKRR